MAIEKNITPRTTRRVPRAPQRAITIGLPQFRLEKVRREGVSDSYRLKTTPFLLLLFEPEPRKNV
uniref:SFRICE_036755 n=1 Tax=Spodoptera frugiperda TaxID=7108 RepID=A0A2H1WSS9_SPOFR